VVNSDNDFPQVTAQLNTCKATQTYKRTSTIWIASPAARLPGEDLKKKKRKKSETRIKAAAGGGEGNTPAFYTLGCNYITAEIFLCTTGIQAHTHTLAPAHIGDIIRA